MRGFEHRFVKSTGTQCNYKIHQPNLLGRFMSYNYSQCRITTYSATLTENILTMIIDGKIVSGLISNISDLLQVFAIIHSCTNTINKKGHKAILIIRQITKKKTINRLNEELHRQKWKSVLVENTDEASLSILLRLGNIAH